MSLEVIDDAPIAPALAPTARLPFAKSTLSIGGRVVSWCGDGLLVSEYALFEASDLVLRAADASAICEAGYRTTARRGLERLARAGATPAAAEDVVRALSREVVRALARCDAARSVANRLGAAELLDGARFRAASGDYQGVWIDLKRLSAALDLPATSVLIQALFLAATLFEVPGTTPVVLSTAAALQGRRPTERTYVRPAMPSVDSLLDALANLVTFATFDARPADPVREARLRPALLARIRERATPEAPPAVRDHLEALERTFLRESPAASSGPEARLEDDDTPEPVPARATAPPTASAPPHTRRPAPNVDLHLEPTTESPSTAIVLHSSTLPSLDRLGGILSPDGDRPAQYVPELVESLSTPAGADESLFGRYDLPTTPLEARIAMTRLARELAREYRVVHGKVLRCDVLAVETMQVQLLRYAGALLQDREVAWQLRRHGALLSEVFARCLGGEWIDIGHREAAYWMMRIPRDLRTRPIGSVFQFVAAGKHAGDLVEQFLELKRRRETNLAGGPRS